MTTPPTWTHNSTDDSYTLISGASHCWVWRSGTQNNWNANVRQHGDLVSSYRHANAEAAKAWCEAQVANRRDEKHD